MQNFSKIGSKHQPTKWLLGILMLFSIFTFTGFSPAMEQDFRQAVKTEVSIAKVIKAGKRTISYQSGYPLCPYRSLATNFGQNFANLQRKYTQLVKVKFDQLVIQQHHMKQALYLFRLIISENSDDELFIVG